LPIIKSKGVSGSTLKEASKEKTELSKMLFKFSATKEMFNVWLTREISIHLLFKPLHIGNLSPSTGMSDLPPILIKVSRDTKFPARLPLSRRAFTACSTLSSLVVCNKEIVQDTRVLEISDESIAGWRLAK
jgi:hypothetical protein